MPSFPGGLDPWGLPNQKKKQKVKTLLLLMWMINFLRSLDLKMPGMGKIFFL
ncbi:unnamed protein product, partial [Vitis vinifera]|uniref:Uncharacterized protein n=1 Tax=Vitis vinifera TaxID=29760 RepID=D7UD70_VITVI